MPPLRSGRLIAFGRLDDLLDILVDPLSVLCVVLSIALTTPGRRLSPIYRSSGDELLQHAIERLSLEYTPDVFSSIRCLFAVLIRSLRTGSW